MHCLITKTSTFSSKTNQVELKHVFHLMNLDCSLHLIFVSRNNIIILHPPRVKNASIGLDTKSIHFLITPIIILINQISIMDMSQICKICVRLAYSIKSMGLQSHTLDPVSRNSTKNAFGLSHKSRLFQRLLRINGEGLEENGKRKTI